MSKKKDDLAIKRIDDMSAHDCMMAINIFLHSHGVPLNELPNIDESSLIAFRKLLKGIIKAWPKEKLIYHNIK
jgi:hypothetical protein